MAKNNEHDRALLVNMQNL